MDDTDGTGDHENFFNLEQETLTILKVTNKKEYTCRKKALRIRTVGTHLQYPENIDKTLLFSELTTAGLQFYTNVSIEKLDELDRNDFSNEVLFHNSVRAKYG